jgi:hypothetical protein
MARLSLCRACDSGEPPGDESDAELDRGSPLFESGEARGGDWLCSQPVLSVLEDRSPSRLEDGDAVFSVPGCQNEERSLGGLWFQPVHDELFGFRSEFEFPGPTLSSSGSWLEVSPLTRCEPYSDVEDDEKEETDEGAQGRGEVLHAGDGGGEFLATATTKADLAPRTTQPKSMQAAGRNLTCRIFCRRSKTIEEEEALFVSSTEKEMFMVAISKKLSREKIVMTPELWKGLRLLYEYL